jgi:hypothetical protein
VKREDFTPKSLTFHPSRFTAPLGQATKIVKQFFKRMNLAGKSITVEGRNRFDQNEALQYNGKTYGVGETPRVFFGLVSLVAQG